MSNNMFKRGTKRFEIAALADSDMSWSDAYALLQVKVHAQVKPWIFSANVKDAGGSRRVPKPMSEQLVELKNEIRRVYALLGRMTEGDVPADGFVPEPEPENIPEPDTEPEHEKPRAKGKRGDEEKRFFFSEWKRIRRWILDRSTANGSAPVDSLDSLRPVRDSRAGINEGISARAMLTAMCLHWKPETMREAGITPVDFSNECEPMGEGFHHLTGYILKLAKARVPIMLVGPAGTGKSYIASSIAKVLSLPYAETPMTAGATPSWLLGRHTIVGFQPSQFLEIYSGGGVFNFEEIDAGDPNMLIVINNALASDRMFNPVNGETYVKHPDFIAISTANTFGLGANIQYTGRERLDFATIDRFRMGRVTVDLDENLAELLMFS